MVAVYGYPLQLTTGNCRHVFKRMPKIFDSVRNVGISLFSQNNSLCKLLNLALKVKFRYVTVCSKMVCMCIWLRRYLRSRVLLGLLSFLLMLQFTRRTLDSIIYSVAHFQFYAFAYFLSPPLSGIFRCFDCNIRSVLRSKGRCVHEWSNPTNNYSCQCDL